MRRRNLLGSAVAAGVFAVIPSGQSVAVGLPAQPSRMVDTNVNLFHWPCRRLPLDDLQLLVGKLTELGVSEAWAGSFEGLLHRDVAGVNERLVEACAMQPLLRPVGTINPELPGWERDWRRCIEVYRMHAIRLYPNYHGYQLDDRRLRRLLHLAADAHVLVQIAVAMEDTRTQHPLIQVAEVELAPLGRLLRDCESVRVQLLNARYSRTLVDTLAQSPTLLCDTARIDGTDTLERLVTEVNPKQILFGSHAPFLIPEAALIRIAEAPLSLPQMEHVLYGNAEAWPH